MNGYKQFFIPVITLLLILACGDNKQQTLRKHETEAVEVDIPQSGWQKTVVVTPADSDTVTRVLTASLGRRLGQHGLKVVSGVTADESAADYIINTKASRQGSQLEISYTLKDVENDTVSEQTVIYEEEAMLTALEAVSMQVSQSMGDTISQESQSRSITGTVFQQYLNAESFRQQGTPAALNSAVRIYKTILREDSLFTDAWLGLAECYLFLTEQGWEQHPVWMELAQQAGFKLQALSPVSGEGEMILGRIALIRGDYRNAELLFRQAIEKSPNLIAAWRGLGQIFGQYGLYDAALKMYDRTLELDSRDIQAGISKALILGGQGKFGESAVLLEKLIAAQPDARYLNSFLALQLFYQDKTGEAMEAVRLGLADASYQPLSHAILAMIQAKQGDLDAALGEVEMEVKPLAGSNGSLATAIAAVYTLLNRKGEAIQWLDRAVQWGYKDYPWLVNDPNFMTLREDERFQGICDTLKVVYDQKRQAYLNNQIL